MEDFTMTAALFGSVVSSTRISDSPSGPANLRPHAHVTGRAACSVPHSQR
jgi:hypothetical protein